MNQYHRGKKIKNYQEVKKIDKRWKEYSKGKYIKLELQKEKTEVLRR